MAGIVNLSKLAENLRQTPETKTDYADRNATGVCDYLADTLLPMLASGDYPKIESVDFDQFDEDGPSSLVCYVQERNRRAYKMAEFNSSLCAIPPARSASRMFF